VEEVKRTFGDLKEILQRIKPELVRYDRLFYQTIISMHPVYDFLKFLASTGIGGVSLSEKQITRLI